MKSDELLSAVPGMASCGRRHLMSFMCFNSVRIGKGN